MRLQQILQVLPLRPPLYLHTNSYIVLDIHSRHSCSHRNASFWFFSPTYKAVEALTGTLGSQGRKSFAIAP
ncbi:Hypothetical predicted protein [Podarcis lilfordi]|uniref:Uncharacterized protein n=1 Tax=Podarcis lilfordi TaxID=74358 RepID=A0AA35KW61_9SAUR|nr:Hypothetical predicted protein [Podarcis lilfordi]